MRDVHPALRCFVTIAYQGNRLYIVGKCNGYRGQVSGELRRLIDAEPSTLKFSVKDVKKLCDIWDRWHLNHMRAGTKKQEDAIRKWRKTHSGDYTYNNACKYLSEIGLLVDDGYKYGTSWLTEEVPRDVLEWLFSLPGVGDTFDEVYSPEISEQAFYEALLV